MESELEGVDFFVFIATTSTFIEIFSPLMTVESQPIGLINGSETIQ